MVLATRNEEKNIGACLSAVKGIADEIVVVDESSEDNTREIAEKLGAKVYKVKHEEIFHKTKQKALDYATGDWILQLDADEIITPQLANEIVKVINMTDSEQRNAFEEKRGTRKYNLFVRHQKLIEERDGKVGKDTGEIVAFFVPRLNLFLGKPLVHAGVYPDPAIRLVKKGKAYFTGKSVHDIMQIGGEVSWLFNDMLHNDSPTLARYLIRLNRYTDIHAHDLKNARVPKNAWNFFKYTIVKPKVVFLRLYLRHKGFMDGIRGFLWSFFSAMHYPIAYYKYWTGKEKMEFSK